MNLDALTTSFSKIEKKIDLPLYLRQVCLALVNKSISKDEIKLTLKKQNINFSIAKVGFLHLILEYIKEALSDNVLTDSENENIKYLKLLFNIRPGDFYLHNKMDVDATIALQLCRIYSDDFISDEEALLKVVLQEIFDLSFDEMNDYSKTEAAMSLQKGIDVKDLNVFFTQKEFFKLNKP